jgi:hypothetical protein
VFTQENGKYQLRVNKKLPGGYQRQKFSEFHDWDGAGAKPNIVASGIRRGRKRPSEIFNEIEVQFTDNQNKFQQGSVVKRRAAVESGVEIARRSTFRLMGLFDSALAGRIATNILNLEWDDAWFEWPADRSAIATQIWDVVALTGAGVTSQDVRVRRLITRGNGFFLHGTEYHDASHSDSVVTEDSPVSASSSDVSTDALPPVPTGLTVTERTYIRQDGRTGSRLEIGWTAPTSFPYYAATRVKVTRPGMPAFVLDESSEGPLYIETTEDVVQYTISAVTISRLGHESAAATINFTTQGKTTYPTDPAYINVSQRGQRVLISFQPGADKDYFEHEVRRGPQGATWSQMVRIAVTKALEIEDDPPLGVWDYAVKSLDNIRYSQNEKRGTITVFFYGPQFQAEVKEAIYPWTQIGGLAGDTYYGYKFDPNIANPDFHSGKWIVEGITVKGQITLMLCRSLSPTTIDAEISANSYTSIQQWETALDTPRRTAPDATIAGIWAPLDSDTAAGVAGNVSGGRVWGGDANGWRNSEFKFRVGGSIDRVGYQAPNVVTKAEAMNCFSLAAYEPWVSISTPWFEQLAQSPVRFPLWGADIELAIRMSTNHALAQTIYKADFDAAWYWCFANREFPPVVPPTDYVTNASGQIIVVYPGQISPVIPIPMLSGTVPAIDVQVMSAHDVLWRIESISNTDCVIRAVDRATGANASGVTLRVTAEDRGGGGTTYNFIP